MIGTVTIPFMIIGFITMARLLRTAMPRTGLVAGLLLGAGMWGFLGLHIIGLAEIPLSAMEDRTAAATALQAIENSPISLAVFLVPFFVGCLLGLLTLALGLLRSGALPRWVPVALLAFLVIDFGTGPVGPIDPHCCTSPPPSESPIACICRSSWIQPGTPLTTILVMLHSSSPRRLRPR